MRKCVVRVSDRLGCIEGVYCVDRVRVRLY